MDNGSESVASLALDDRLLLNRRDLLAAMMRRFGGIEGVADLVHVEFDDLAVGGPARRDILKMLIQGVLSHGIDDESDDDTTPEQATKELRQVMFNYLRELDDGDELDDLIGEVRGANGDS